MLIKKFENGKIKLTIQKEYDLNIDGTISDSVYHDDIEGNDLYLNQINGYQYLVDFNTSLVYELGSYLLQNPLNYLLDSFQTSKSIYFYPLSRKESKSLLQDLENGY